MKASELIKELERLMTETSSDPEVGAQSHGCCNHAHTINSVEMGGAHHSRVAADEEEMIVIRV